MIVHQCHREKPDSESTCCVDSIIYMHARERISVLSNQLLFFTAESQMKCLTVLSLELETNYD